MKLGDIFEVVGGFLALAGVTAILLLNDLEIGIPLVVAAGISCCFGILVDILRLTK